MIGQDGDLAAGWAILDARKGDMNERNEQYARWTVPHVFPTDDNVRSESPEETKKGNVAIGARLANHIAHRVVDTMFPNDRPFFSIAMTPEAKREFDATATDEERGATLDGVAQAENAAMRNLNLTAYRPVAVEAMLLKVITGNALIYRLPNDKRVVYSTRDYCVSREIDGTVVEVILRDLKKFMNLPEDVQEKVRITKPTVQDDDDVEMYTYFYRKSGKWYMRQAVDEVEIELGDPSYNEADFPCLVLAWNLSRGDNYGRGLVEDYAVSFHNVDVLTECMIDLIGISADVKFLVSDTSSFDVSAWNDAKRGEYVPGKEGDITVPDVKFAVEINIIAEAIAKLERELAQAFLLSSAGVRDAERVTAEEIRFFAREIESAFGGLYSRLALDWQKREAEYALAQIDFQTFLPELKQIFEPVVTTGLESLSREGKIDKMRLAFADLQMLDSVPEDLRKGINPLKFLRFVFRQRDVDPDDFLHTEQEMQAMREQEMQQQQQLMQEQGAVDVAKAQASK